MHINYIMNNAGYNSEQEVITGSRSGQGLQQEARINKMLYQWAGGYDRDQQWYKAIVSSMLSYGAEVGNMI